MQFVHLRSGIVVACAVLLCGLFPRGSHQIHYPLQRVLPYSSFISIASTSRSDSVVFQYEFVTAFGQSAFLLQENDIEREQRISRPSSSPRHPAGGDEEPVGCLFQHICGHLWIRVIKTPVQADRSNWEKKKEYFCLFWTRKNWIQWNTIELWNTMKTVIFVANLSWNFIQIHFWFSMLIYSTSSHVCKAKYFSLKLLSFAGKNKTINISNIKLNI